MAELAPKVARPDVGDGPEGVAHYARNDELAQARREGRAVKALRGTLFHPHANPHPLPVRRLPRPGRRLMPTAVG